MVEPGKSPHTAVNGQTEGICKGCGRKYLKDDERQLYCVPSCRTKYHGRASKEGQKVLENRGPKLIKTLTAGVEAILRGGGWYTAGEVQDILEERYRIKTIAPNAAICDLTNKRGIAVEQRKRGRHKEFQILTPTGEGGPTPPGSPSPPPKGQGKLFK